jgi:hypothetical protein
MNYADGAGVWYSAPCQAGIIRQEHGEGMVGIYLMLRAGKRKSRACDPAPWLWLANGG